MNQELVQYLQQQIRTLDERLKRFTHSSIGQERPKRVLFSKLEQYVDGFIQKRSNARMVIMPGFRGVGKTTLMSQICAEYKEKNYEVLFLSVEDVRALFDVGISQIITAYEEILGKNLESVSKTVLIFLDEIQTDPKWAVTLKSLFERTTNVFFCCTGSAAVVLQSSGDLARRAIFEKVPPMSFTEYEMTKNNIAHIDGLSDNIKEALYFSENAEDVYKKLNELKSKVNKYWSEINRIDIKTYLSYGSLPFSFDMVTYDYDSSFQNFMNSIEHFKLPDMTPKFESLNYNYDSLSKSLGTWNDPYKLSDYITKSRPIIIDTKISRPNETAIYDAISLILDKIIKVDLPMLGSFENNTLSAVKRILFAIAENDATSFSKLEEKFSISRHTISSVFDALEKAELLIKIPAYGANMTIANKASKYLFMSSAIRMSFFYFTGIENTYNTRQGKLLEDSIGAHLYREFIMKDQGSIRYDSEEGGADFILQILNKKQIIIEVGLGKKDTKQVNNTAKKLKSDNIKSDYNLIFSTSELKLDKENNILFVPLDYYFLV